MFQILKQIHLSNSRKEDKNMNYYISDTHFGCVNKYENRTLEHDKLIKENWNKKVTNSDTVYILGDIGRIGSNKDNEYLCSLISTLKGRKSLILWNHDYMKDIRISQLFTEICDYKEITDNFNGMNHTLVLSHYPILFWNGQHKGYIHLYGHVHLSDEYKVYQNCLKEVNDYFKDRELKGYTDCPQARAYNISCMLYNYTPMTLKEMLDNN